MIGILIPRNVVDFNVDADRRQESDANCAKNPAILMAAEPLYTGVTLRVWVRARLPEALWRPGLGPLVAVKVRHSWSGGSWSRDRVGFLI